MTEALDIGRIIRQSVDAPRGSKESTLEETLSRYRRYLAYAPHEGQKEFLTAFLAAKMGLGPREIWVKTGKQAGKSDLMAAVIADEMLFWNNEAHIWVASGIYEHSENVFDRAMDILKASGKVKTAHRSDVRPKVREFDTGGYLKSRSWQEAQNLEAEQLDLLICDEAHTLDEERYARTRPRMVARKGISVFIGSPWETTAFFNDMIDRVEDDLDRVLISWTTEDNPKREIQEMLEVERRVLPPEMYAQLYLGIARAPSLLVFPDFNKERHQRTCPFDAEKTVTLWIDPGKGTYSVLAAQFYPVKDYPLDETWIIDEVYQHNSSDRRIIAEAASRSWWRNVVGGVIDIAARQSSTVSEDTTEQIWRQEAGLSSLRSHKVDVEVGTMRLQDIIMDHVLGQPLLYIDHGCRETIQEFSLYKRNSAGKIVDSHNHSLKALTYGVIDHYGLVASSKNKLEEPTYSGPSWRYPRRVRRGFERLFESRRLNLIGRD